MAKIGENAILKNISQALITILFYVHDKDKPGNRYKLLSINHFSGRLALHHLHFINRRVQVKYRKSYAVKTN